MKHIVVLHLVIQERSFQKSAFPTERTNNLKNLTTSDCVKHIRIKRRVNCLPNFRLKILSAMRTRQLNFLNQTHKASLNLNSPRPTCKPKSLAR